MIQVTNNRIIINFFGIKIKLLRKSSLADRKKYAEFYSSFASCADIPKAEGGLRIFQEANLQLLLEFKKFCQQNNLTFWLNYGTLLGAVRHKGYIPWDDDIDVSMMREDYEKLISLFENEYKNHPDLGLGIFSNGKNRCFLKLKSNNCAHVFLDIFPFDYHYKPLDDIEKQELSKQISKINHINKFAFPKNTNKFREYLRKQTNKIILKNNEINQNTKPAVFMGIDFPHGFKNKVYDYETIFPLKELEFEGQNFLVPNNCEKVLSDLYGDYMKIPKDVYPRHRACNSMQQEEIEQLKMYSCGAISEYNK